MEERRPVWGDVTGGGLCLCALANFFALKAVGHFSWYFPIFGTLVPLLAIVLDTALLALYLNLLLAAVWHTEWGAALWSGVFDWVYALPEDLPRWA